MGYTHGSQSSSPSPTTVESITSTYAWSRSELPLGVNGLWEPFIRYARDGSTSQISYLPENLAGDQDSITIVLHKAKHGRRNYVGRAKDHQRTGPFRERVCSARPCVSIQVDPFLYNLFLCGGSRYNTAHERVCRGCRGKGWDVGGQSLTCVRAHWSSYQRR
jgi:hypothetical protein